MNAEAVSKDYGGFAESKSKCLPVNFNGKSPCVLSPVAFCMGGWRCIRVRDAIMNAVVFTCEFQWEKSVCP